jgi:hypothetical protein
VVFQTTPRHRDWLAEGERLSPHDMHRYYDLPARIIAGSMRYEHYAVDLKFLGSCVVFWVGCEVVDGIWHFVNGLCALSNNIETLI